MVAMLACALLAALAVSAGSEVPVGYSALASFDHLWQWSGAVETDMVSSTDPSGGNMDMMNYHGRYRGERLLARIDGPGCIYRIWSAMPSGKIKVYLDGSKKAEIKCGFKKYLEGKCEGLPGDFAVGRAANYMPIPFEKSIIITAPGFHMPGYYQISFQTYDRSVPVTSFSMDTAMTAADLDSARARWEGPSHKKHQKGKSELNKEKSVAHLAPGKETTALKISGAGVIRKLKVKNPDDLSDPLQGLRMLIYWDGAKEPAVSVPVDAFFLNRFDLKEHWEDGSLSNLFIKAGDKGYKSYLPMPFSKSVTIAFVNDGPARKAEVYVKWQEMDSLPDNSMRFHAEYREKDFETDLSKDNIITMLTPIDPATNYVVLEREGKGHYVGCVIFVESVGVIWWGEGDEMTYIDGASEPQIQGTGTEDEFNWSWGYMLHESPVSGTLPVVPECEGGPNKCWDIMGHNAAYRFRPSDYVPFEESIKVSYEILGVAHYELWKVITGNVSQHRGDDYSSVAYWYEIQQ
jgi:hypothetical protein